MVKIRYSELPSGLHVAAAADREGTVVYLQPGLTSAQRRAALTRVRSSARMGHLPMLPAPAMARAIAADRVRTNARIGAAAARRHPVLFLPPVVLLVVSALAFVFMSIQPLTAATRGAVGAANPPFHITAPLIINPAHVQPTQQRRHRAHSAVAPGLAASGSARSAVQHGCAALQAPSSRQAWPTPPTRSGSPLLLRCIGHPQRWTQNRRL